MYINLLKAAFLISRKAFSVTLVKITTLKYENNDCAPKRMNNKIATLLMLSKLINLTESAMFVGAAELPPNNCPIMNGKINPAEVESIKKIHPIKKADRKSTRLNSSHITI